MDSVKLTKDADKTICEIYAQYLNRRDDGATKRVAKDFSDKGKWPDPDWATEDGQETLNELKRAGMISRDILGGFQLKDEAIVYMENRFKNGLHEVLQYLSKVKDIINPF